MRHTTSNQVKKKILAQIKREFDSSTLNDIFNRYFKKCKNWKLGRNRLTFIFSNFVVKLPVTHGGFGDNDWEGSVSNNPNIPYNSYQIQYARTRLIYAGEHKDIPIVFMERIQHASVDEIEARLGREPEWCWSVDCGQVGFNRRGRLVAYDYGIN